MRVLSLCLSLVLLVFTGLCVAADKLDPEKSKTHFALARVYRRLGRQKEAGAEMALFQKLKSPEEPTSAAAPAGMGHD